MLVATAVGVGPTFGEPAKKDAAPAATSTKPPVVLAPTVEVSGFRSAKFGMSEADVRAAIVRDLGVSRRRSAPRPMPASRHAFSW
jgi:hypothetical protein